MLRELSHDGYGAAGTDEDGRSPHDVAVSFGCCINSRMMRIDRDSRACAEYADRAPDPFRRVVLNPLPVSRDHLLRLLIGHQPNTDLCHSASGNHGLGACSGEAAHNAMYFKGWARPQAS